MHWPSAGRRLPRVAAGAVAAATGLVTGLELGLPVQVAVLVLVIGGVAALRAVEEVRRAAECRICVFIRWHASALGLLSVVLVLVPHSSWLTALLGAAETAPALTGAAAQVAVLAAGSCSLAALTARLAGARRVMVVGRADSVGRAIRLLGAERGCEVVGIGLMGTIEKGDALDHGVPTCVGPSLERLAEIAVEWGADTVAVVPLPELGPRAMRRLSWHLSSDSVRLAVLCLPEGVRRRRISTARLGGVTSIEVDVPRASSLDRAGKLVLDRVGALVLLVLGLPLLAVCAVLISLETRGAPVFRQTRVGRDGSTFTMYKLRSMVVDAESAKAALADRDEGNGRLFKMRRDPRITRIGAVIRKTSLDELPQLVNVVRGEMSLVGPRPALPCEVAQYDDEERRRLAVLPGLTGLWQVSGRSDLSHEESVRLDLEYTDNWDLREDLRIGLRTIAAVARSKGAY